MSDDYKGGIGCVFIILVIGGCYMHFYNVAESESVAEQMDAIVNAAEEHARESIKLLRDKYLADKQRRDDRFAIEAKRLLNLIEVEERKSTAARNNSKEMDSREDELRSFALKEVPAVWRTLQVLSAERDVYVGRINAMEVTLRRFGKDFRTDADVIRLRACKEQLEEQMLRVRAKLESAYIASKKCEIMPQHEEFNTLMRSSLKEGVVAAEMAEKKYKELKEKEQNK